MSIHDGGTVTPHRLGRGLLVGGLALLAAMATFALLVVLLFDYASTCEGWDDTPPADPGSGQAQLCSAWDGSLAFLFYVVPAAALAVTVLMGVQWIGGRRHGAWFLLAVAAMVLSPVIISKVLNWPDDTAPQHVIRERIGDAAGLR